MEGFSFAAFSAALEPLHSINRFYGTEIFKIELIALDGNTVVADNGVPIATDSTVQQARLDRLSNTPASMIMLCGRMDADYYPTQKLDPNLRSWLCASYSEGTAILSLCHAVWPLAQTGLLQDKKCAVMWDLLGTFSEIFPDVSATAVLYKSHRNIITCPGGVAASDAVFDHIKRGFDSAAQSFVQDAIIVTRWRNDRDRQRLPFFRRFSSLNPQLISLVQLMEDNIEEPLTLRDIAKHLKLSRRQVERICQQHLHTTPLRYYRELRLQRGRDLLQQTSMQIREISLACGFGTISYFSKCFAEQYGHSPTEERERFACEYASEFPRLDDQMVPVNEMTTIDS